MLTCTLNDGLDTLAKDYSNSDYKQSGSTAHLVPAMGHITPSLPPAPAKLPSRILGMRGSDIDKYSRVIFPIMFVSFHMVYWMIYLSISGEIPADLVYLQ